MTARERCWVVTDGAAGNENQALALARGLGVEAPRVLRLRPRWPWNWLAPDGPNDPRDALPIDDRVQLDPPWPELAIGCGRAAALFTLGLKRVSGGATRIVQILDPRRHRDRFDALVVPRHDRLAGENVVTCIGALNRVDDDWLAEGRARFPALGELPAPRTAVLIGGPTRDIPMHRDDIAALLARLSGWHRRDGGSFLVTASRRTPPAVVSQSRRFLADQPGCLWAPGDDAPNPYAGLLGWADRIVVTPDSTNLLTEACAVGVPVFSPLPRSLPRRRQALVSALITGGYLHGMDDALDGAPAAPLRELPSVADAVRRLLDGEGLRRPTTNSSVLPG